MGATTSKTTPDSGKDWTEWTEADKTSFVFLISSNAEFRKGVQEKIQADVVFKTGLTTEILKDPSFRTAVIQSIGTDAGLKKEIITAIKADPVFIETLKGGPKGDTGPAGSAGIAGPKGEIGLTGPAGIQGIAGPIGPKGELGLTGPAGIQGIQGLTGIAGPKGEIGLTGPAGIQGLKGDTGIAGPQGIPGAPGEVSKQFLKENSLWCADGDICTVPKNLSLAPGKAVTLRDQYHGMVYDSGVDGPNIFGVGGGKLTTSTIDGRQVGKEALRWDTFGNTTFGGGAIFGAGATFNGFANLNGTTTHGGLATFNANARFNKNISVHPDNVFSIDEVNVPGGRANIDSKSARFGGTHITQNWKGIATATTAEISNDLGTYKALILGGNSSGGNGRQVQVYDDLTVDRNATIKNQLNAKKITIGSWNIEETAAGELQFNKSGSGSYVVKPMSGDRWVDWTAK